MKLSLLSVAVMVNVAAIVAAVTLPSNQPPPPPLPTTTQSHKSVVEAYFGPGRATTGYFQSSIDLKHWATFYSFPYPTNGAVMRGTNVSFNDKLFFRAGYAP